MTDTLKSALGSLRSQWQANRRLRIAIGIALLVAVLNLALSWNDARRETISSYQTDRALLSRLQGAAAESAWPTRAADADKALTAMEATLKTVAGPGEAQAELQALLSNSAMLAGMQQPRVRTDGVAEVEGVPDLLEVSARVDGATTPASTEAFLRDLAARPWLRVERVEIRDGAPGQVQVIARGFFKRASPLQATP